MGVKPEGEKVMTDIYERLGERLDMFPQGFPKTKSGVELKILKELFSPDEAEIMCRRHKNGQEIS